MHFSKFTHDGGMSKAICTTCQFLYDSRLGLPESKIPAGTPFGIADDSVFMCPQCGGSKDVFMEVVESIIEVEDPTDLTEIEAEHVPVYVINDEETLVVRVGQMGCEHPQDKEHMIEWIEVRDESGDVVDRVYFGENEEEITAAFSIDTDEDFTVLACCSEHGIWKGISHESTGL